MRGLPGSVWTVPAMDAITPGAKMPGKGSEGA